VERYVITILPFFYLLIAYGIWKIKYILLKVPVTIIFFGGMALGVYTQYHEISKIPWSHIAQFLEQYTRKDDIILVSPHYWETPLKYYMKTSIPITPIQRKNKFLTDISNELPNHQRIWLVTVVDRYNQPPIIMADLEVKYHDHWPMFKLSSPSLVDVVLYTNEIQTNIPLSGQTLHQVGTFASDSEGNQMFSQTGERGFLVSGPNWQVKDGKYRVGFTLKTSGESKKEVARLDVHVWDKVNLIFDKVLCSKEIYNNDNTGWQKYNLEFITEKYPSGNLLYEYRVFSTGAGVVQINSIVLEKVQ